MFLRLLIVSYLLFSYGFAKNVKVILTFDDFPMGPSVLYGKTERVEEFVRKLNKTGIQAAFFCIGEQVDSDEGKKCLEMVSKNHVVANHSYTHSHLSQTSLEFFQKEIEKTESLLVSCENFRKWFRFPYLDYGDREKTGGTSEKRIRAFQYLNQTGYQHAYVTINTFDWYIDSQLKKALAAKKTVDWLKLKEAYLELVDGWMAESHEKWSHSLKKDFVHVLLFHQNDLNALYLEEIVDRIRKKNWIIASPDEGFKDPIRYLSYFPNSKGRLFKKPFTITIDYVDNLLSQKDIFK